ncbi:MAG: hypothetical protein ACKO0Z_13555 [Betaproteobacteria bacterium]
MTKEFYKRHGFSSLLASPHANPKIEKGNKLGNYASRPLHLAPAKLSGFEVCPMATAGCRAACLHTAGNPAYMKGKEKARVNRTRAFFTDRAAFMTTLATEIEKTIAQNKKAKKKTAIRLNATSDIVWESMPVEYKGKRFSSLMEAFPRVQFYDYTKRHNRKDRPANYHLTYSLAENNDAQALAALQAGMSVAAVFNVGRNKPLPATFAINGQSFHVIDGDPDDRRFLDPSSVIVGLRAKGKAKNDASGFVRNVP